MAARGPNKLVMMSEEARICKSGSKLGAV